MSLSDTISFIQQQMTRYVLSTYLIFCTIGCFLNVLLLSRRQFRSASCCTYFLAASIPMIISVAFGTGTSLYALNNVDPTTTILAFCKLRIYILQSSSMMYRWCLTVACFDRYALSSINVRLRNFARVRIARRVVLVIVLIWLVLPVHTLIFYNLKAGTCGIVYNKIAALYHSIFTTVTGSVLPVAIMITCSVLIHHNLIVKQQRRQVNLSQATGNTNQGTRLERRRDQQVLIMLLAQAFFYVILITPLMCFYFYTAVTLNIPNKSADRLTIERFVQFLSETMVLLFPTSSFYIYTMASQMFRNELMRMIRSALPCEFFVHAHRIQPVTNDDIGRAVTAHRLTQPVVLKKAILERTNGTAE